jgi:hypothetical protein
MRISASRVLQYYVYAHPGSSDWRNARRIFTVGRFAGLWMRAFKETLRKNAMGRLRICGWMDVPRA